MPKVKTREFTQLIRQYGAHLESRARALLPLLPAGWLALVHSMLDRVEQILTEDERPDFRWTAIRAQGSTLEVSWLGASSSEGLVDQITEEAAIDAAATCVECGEPAVLGALDRSGPRCLQHCSRTGGADAATQWESTTAHLMQILQESIGTSSPNTDAKAVAAALPFMMRQAGGYFRAPDRDVQAITHQLREGIRRLDSIVRTYVKLSLVPYEC